MADIIQADFKARQYQSVESSEIAPNDHRPIVKKAPVRRLPNGNETETALLLATAASVAVYPVLEIVSAPIGIIMLWPYIAAGVGLMYAATATIRSRLIPRSVRYIGDRIAYRRHIRAIKAQQLATVQQTPSQQIAPVPRQTPPQAQRSKPQGKPSESDKFRARLIDALNDQQVVCSVEPALITSAVIYVPINPMGNSRGVSAARVDIDRALPSAANYVDPIPGSQYPGWAIPREKPDTVLYGDLIEKVPAKAPHTSVVIGVDMRGKSVIIDIAKAPHMIIAGVTGSGKSVASYSIILSLLERNTPEQLQMIIFDQKTTEYAPFYHSVGHLAVPIMTDSRKLPPVTQRLVDEMKKRQTTFSSAKVRDIDEYREKGGKLPVIVVLIDELRDVLMELDKDDSDEVVNQLTRLAQCGRSIGIHLCIMTQRPDSDAIPGKLKSQLPAKLLLKMEYTDAQTLLMRPPLDIAKIPGNGAAFLSDGIGGGYTLERVQCAYVDSDDMMRRIAAIEMQHGKPEYTFDDSSNDSPKPPVLSSDHPKYKDAVIACVESGSPTVATLKSAGITSGAVQTKVLRAMDRDGFTAKLSGNKRTVIMTIDEAKKLL